MWLRIVAGLLAASFCSAEDFSAELERLYREAARRVEQEHGGEHGRTADAWRDLALLLLEHGKPPRPSR